MDYSILDVNKENRKITGSNRGVALEKNVEGAIDK
jgi:hypothetical protein